MAGRLSTAAGRPPGTASRLSQAQMVPGTASGQRQAGGVALNAQVTITDRPATQQGLGGMKMGARRQTRLVQDKTYFLGLLRTKINELMSEIGKMRRDLETANEDQSSYVGYEKRAEQLAAELKSLQGELGDYNTLVDKMNLDHSIADIQADCEDLKAQNARETHALEGLFEQKKDKEQLIHQLENELQQEKNLAENLVTAMKPDMQRKYSELKTQNDQLLKKIDNFQQELDKLNMKKAQLEEELVVSPVKQEALRLYEQLHEVREKRDQLAAEMQSQNSESERERLLKQVKDDNIEISRMDKQADELKEKIAALRTESQQLDQDIEESQGERNQKYKELKKREEQMDEFLSNFDQNKTKEADKIRILESNIVNLLEQTSRNMLRVDHMPSQEQYASMKQDLKFKEGEMNKSLSTATALTGESAKLQADLQKIEQLEAKVMNETEQLKEKIAKMKSELHIYSDLDKVKDDAEARKKKLAEDKVVLHKRKEAFKKMMQNFSSQYEAQKSQLNDNETYQQLCNLEKKWQHHEQNNFVMKEFISAKSMEGDFQTMAKRAMSMVNEYNKYLQDKVATSSKSS